MTSSNPFLTLVMSGPLKRHISKIIKLIVVHSVKTI